MSRCRHKFELTVVACPHGCGGPKTERRMAPPNHFPKIPARENGPPKPFTDEELSQALAEAPNVREAQRRLGVSYHRVRDRAKSVPAIWELFLAARARGLASRGVKFTFARKRRTG